GHFHRMLTSWTEAATWNSMANGIQTNGTEAVASYDSSAGNPSLTPNYLNWSPPIDVTTDVQAWSNGLANNGSPMIPWVSGTGGWCFRSSDFGTVPARPQLTIFYGPSPAPPPVANTLDVVNGQAVYSGGSATPNNTVALALAGGTYTITDASGPIT